MPFAKLSYKREENHSSLPSTLQTPSGLALIEIQGTIHIGNNPLTNSGLNLKQSSLSFDEDGDIDMNELSKDSEAHKTQLTRVGEFTFVDKNVTLIIGQHQRLRGKIVSLKMPLAVLKLVKQESGNGVEIPVVEIIRQKVLFNSRPEPVV